VRRSFASDNNAGVAPEILAAIVAANDGDALGYGEDEWTARAVERFRAHFGAETEVLFSFNGTGANVTALAALLQPWQSVLVPASAHLQTDECAAFERFTGSKMIPIATEDGKLRCADLEPYLQGKGVVHFPQPRVV
jgi:threonine aldolase